MTTNEKSPDQSAFTPRQSRQPAWTQAMESKLLEWWLFSTSQVIADLAAGRGADSQARTPAGRRNDMTLAGGVRLEQAPHSLHGCPWIKDVKEQRRDQRNWLLDRPKSERSQVFMEPSDNRE
jgi:hypothetical protein